MLDERDVLRIERGGITLGLVLIGAGIAELAGAIDLAPVAAYVGLAWAVAVVLWAVRRAAA